MNGFVSLLFNICQRPSHSSPCVYNGPEKYLAEAIEDGDVRIAELLLKNSVEIEFDCKCKTENTFFPQNSCKKEKIFRFFEHKTSRMNMLLMLMRNNVFDLKYKNVEGQNLLSILVRVVDEDDGDAVEIAKFLIESGLSIHEDDEEDRTPVYFALEQKNVPMISFFIKEVADSSYIKRQDDRSPIMRAVQLGSKKVVSLLLSLGATVDAGGDTNWTALHTACCKHHEELIPFLIRKGANISAEWRTSFRDAEADSDTPFKMLKPHLLGQDRDLGEEDEYYDPCRNDRCIVIMIKEFAKLSFEDKPISSIDMKLILSNENPKLQEIFESCKTELKLMSSTKCDSYSFYTFFKMSKNINKFAKLTKNKKLLANFDAKLKNFSYYQNDLREMRKEAIEIRDRLEINKSKLDLVFKDHLPDVVIQKLTNIVTAEDLLN